MYVETERCVSCAERGPQGRRRNDIVHIRLVLLAFHSVGIYYVYYQTTATLVKGVVSVARLQYFIR